MLSTKDMALWIDARICGSCHQGYTCNEYDCEQARKIADMLSRMTVFKGKDSEGKDVSGLLVPD
ncbi:MAG: hypothetical protein HY914_13625 [Desulfomonile tiedjei]|nr:hypothetical protein [Desulfomonile tiedjei]